MRQKTRDGVLTDMPNGQDKALSVLYGNPVGRAILKPLVAPMVSKIGGKFMSGAVSRVLIPSFIKNNHIDMSQFEEADYPSYNAFFTRKIRPGARIFDMEPTHFVSPCDSKLTVLPITADGKLTIKHTDYTVSSLLKDDALAREYYGGYAMIFRLTVDDYHRYSYPVDGEKSENTVIPGALHTVNPVANDYYPIYKENAREYCTIENDVFGKILMMEVGALMVGKIVNHHGVKTVKRGEEKGYFEFGGSTVVVLTKNVVQLDADILKNSEENIETVVKLGEKIGISR